MLYLMVDDLTEEHWEKIKKLMVDNASCEVPSKYQNTPQGFLLFLLSENLLLIESKVSKSTYIYRLQTLNMESISAVFPTLHPTE